MDNFLNSLPRSVLVAGALAVGLLFIFIMNPPHTKCDSQFEIFQKAQTPFLYKDAEKKFMDETVLQSSMKNCKDRNLPGSCFQFFEGLRILIKDLKTVSYDCRSEVLSKSEVTNSIWQSLGFIFEIAWGVQPPTSYLDKMGWLDSVHVSVFCELQSFAKEGYPVSDWEAFREKTLANLPGASTMDRKEVWNRSLFTLKCP